MVHLPAWSSSAFPRWSGRRIPQLKGQCSASRCPQLSFLHVREPGRDTLANSASLQTQSHQAQLYLRVGSPRVAVCPGTPQRSSGHSVPTSNLPHNQAQSHPPHHNTLICQSLTTPLAQANRLVL